MKKNTEDILRTSSNALSCRPWSKGWGLRCPLRQQEDPPLCPETPEIEWTRMKRIKKTSKFSQILRFLTPSSQRTQLVSISHFSVILSHWWSFSIPVAPICTQDSTYPDLAVDYSCHLKILLHSQFSLKLLKLKTSQDCGPERVPCAGHEPTHCGWS